MPNDFTMAQGIQAGGDIFSGTMALISAFKQAKLVKQEGEYALFDNYHKAALVRDEGSRFRAKQAMAYIGSGVELIGTPQLVMKETMRKAKLESDFYKFTGDRLAWQADKTAERMKREGVTQFISSIIQTGAKAAGAGG